MSLQLKQQIPGFTDPLVELSAISSALKVMRRCALSCLFFIGLILSQSAYAHTLGQSYLYVSINDEELSARFEVTASDLNAALGLDLATDGSIKVGQLGPYEEQIAAYLKDHVRIAPDGQPAQLHFKTTTLRSPKLAQYVMSEFSIPLPAGIPEFIDVEYSVLFDSDSKQLGFLLIENNWRTGTFDNEAHVALTFTPEDRIQRLDLTSSTLLHGIWRMVLLGAQHIVEGIDHVMFLLALLLTSVVRRENKVWQGVENFRIAVWNVIKIVTLFTVAHTITLSLVTFETLTISPRIVESIIAGSIVIAALEVFYPIFRSRIGLVVFLFGLFHGAGFASILLSMNLHADYLPLSLLGFNIGVELGQIAIVLLIFPLLFLIRSRSAYLRLGMQVTAACLIVIASYWFIERAFAVDLPAGEYAQKLLTLFD